MQKKVKHVEKKLSSKIIVWCVCWILALLVVGGGIWYAMDKDLLSFNFFGMKNNIVEKWDSIVVDYVGKHVDWTVFDTSIQSVAEENGLYNPNRNYDEWLEFTVGAWNMIKGFEEAVEGMKVWETKTAEMPPEMAYGERKEENIIRVSKEELGDTSGAEVGAQVLLGGYYPAKIYEITDTDIAFDTNSELAGETLIFDITVKSIQKAGKEE